MGLRAYASRSASTYSLVLSAPSTVSSTGTYSVRIFPFGGTAATLEISPIDMIYDPTEDSFLPGGGFLFGSLTEDQYNSLDGIERFTRTDSGVTRLWFDHTQVELYSAAAFPTITEEVILGYVEGTESIDIPVDESFPPKIDLFTLGELSLIHI